MRPEAFYETKLNDETKIYKQVLLSSKHKTARFSTKSARDLAKELVDIADLIDLSEVAAKVPFSLDEKKKRKKR